MPEIDMKLGVAALADELGLKRLVVEGGPTVNGSFVSAGLVDEINLLILPLVDGRGEHPASFGVRKEAWKAPAYRSLTSAEIA